MSEYIVDFGNKSTAFVGLAMAEAESHGANLMERVVRCRDCKHGHITVDGERCKWCDRIATHDMDGDEPNNGYDPEPYFSADLFCAWGERKEDAEGGAAPESYIRSDEEGSICPAPRTSVIFEGQKFTFDAAESEVFKRLLIAHLRRLAGLGVDA